MSGLIENVLQSNGYSMADICSALPEFEEILARQKPLSYQSFVNQLDRDLENIISNTESGKQHHHSKGEDEITEHIISQLKIQYPSVHHDAQQGGHCDIYIEVKSASGLMYKWVMEAKLWKGFEYVYKGLINQLLGSYAIGGENNCCGGIIFYSQLSNGGKYAMDSWFEGLTEKGLTIENKRPDGLRFETNHKLNQGTGSNFSVKHYCIDVYHGPTQVALDKEAKKQEAKIQKRIDDALTKKGE